MSFEIPDPKKQFSNLENNRTAKYKLGDIANKVHELKSKHPIFAFDFVSLIKSDICFNSKRIDRKKDYLKFIEGLKKISRLTYDELSKDTTFHFHEVDFNETSISTSDFIKYFYSGKINVDQCPTVYQFEIFSEARIFGFIHNYIFYLVLFDRNHTIYPRK